MPITEMQHTLYLDFIMLSLFFFLETWGLNIRQAGVPNKPWALSLVAKGSQG